MPERNLLDKMVERVSWMSPIHYEILEFFENHDIWISARPLAENIGYDRNYTSRECGTLVEQGILEKKDTIYSLSDRGRAFLAGEIDADELTEPE